MSAARKTPRGALREVKVYEAAIPPAWVARLRTLLLAAGPSTALNWYPLELAPRSFFEQVIASLHRLARPGPDCVGAEYWWRTQAAHSGFHLHFDRDEAIGDRIVSPHTSSILYLSDAGGPTLILDAVPDRAQPPRHGVGVFPQRARYATFPGSLFHGVWPGGKSRWPRVAFFVNWWRSRPRACAEPPAAQLRALPLVRDGRAGSRPRLRTSPPEAFRPSQILDRAGWQEALARQRRG